MTADPGVAPASSMQPAEATARSISDQAEDVRIARLHLRLGMLTIALAELEELEGRSALDAEGLGALAEARWRAGDLEGAADAATRHLDGGGGDPIALCVA